MIKRRVETTCMAANIHRRAKGFSLLELSAATLVMSVGSLAVFTLFLQWHAALIAAENYQHILQEAQHARPEPKYQRRFQHLPCELDKG
ncbi:MAG: type II secretion system GspH family protein [Firmicutes bacterium]|nr:type II secretion system GspH family protein [Bacillota bacterium]